MPEIGASGSASGDGKRPLPHGLILDAGSMTFGGAGEGNRTLVISLEGCCSTIELHPRTRSSTCEPAFAKAAAGCLRDRPACQPQRRRPEGWGGREGRDHTRG